MGHACAQSFGRIRQAPDPAPSRSDPSKAVGEGGSVSIRDTIYAKCAYRYTTRRDVLEGYFAGNERARGYVLDDQGALRKHMAIFIDGRQIRDRNALTDAVDEDAVVDLIQSLSGELII